MSSIVLSIVVSAYNEEESIVRFYNAVTTQLTLLNKRYELIFVNDGSTDETGDLVRNLSKEDRHVKCIHFSRNFGHEAAMIAGIDYSSGEFVICMDADLQHPVEYIPEMLAEHEAGSEIVSMVRRTNEDAGKIKNVTSTGFYKLINIMSDNHMEPGASDFFGVSRTVADILKDNYRDSVRFLRGYVQNMGFKRTILEYDADKRAGGQSKYSLIKLSRFAVDTLVNFSDIPLKLGLYAGGAAIIIGVIMVIYTIISWAKAGTPNGYATIICLLCFMFAILFFMVGIIGKYIANMFAELKDRPIYIVEDTDNF